MPNFSNSLLRFRLDGDTPKLGMTRDPDRIATLLMKSSAGQRCWVHMPECDTTDGTPLPVLLVLHGAGKHRFWNLAEQVASWAKIAKAHNVIVVNPESRGSTWDFIASKRTARNDVDFLESCLQSVRQSFSVDRVGVIGISDGGSMALSLAVHNPSIFEAAISVSAGFCADAPKVHGVEAAPKLFMIHGSHDQMFPLERVGLPLKERMRTLGYDCEHRVALGHGHVPAGWQSEFIPAWLAMARGDKAVAGRGGNGAVPGLVSAVMRRFS